MSRIVKTISKDGEQEIGTESINGRTYFLRVTPKDHFAYDRWGHFYTGYIKDEKGQLVFGCIYADTKDEAVEELRLEELANYAKEKYEITV